MNALTAVDIETIAWQLGRPPAGARAVAHRCVYGHPQVVLTHPLHRQGGEFIVFPTLFWLSCPFLVAEVSRLESGGAVRRFEVRLAAEPNLARRYAEAHDSYRCERAALLSREDRRFLRQVNAIDRLETGIAGLSNPRRVKCLHSHLAHYLACRGNPIGEAVATDLPRLFCLPERVKCAAAVRGEVLPGCRP